MDSPGDPKDRKAILDKSNRPNIDVGQLAGDGS